MNNEGVLSSISVVFPAFNEEANVERAVELARNALKNFVNTTEIIVVNDGSSDRTAEICDHLAAQDKSVVVVHHPQNMGYGAALRSGFAVAKSDYVFFTDSDLQFDLEEIKLLIDWIGEYDIVAGYRAKRADPLHRRFNAWSWGVLVRTVLGLKVRDIDCAFKLFRRKVLDTVQLGSVGAMVNTEILVQAKNHGFTIKEIPVSHYPRLAGEQTGANIKVIIKAFRELFKMHGKLRQMQRLNKAPGKPTQPVYKAGGKS